MLWLCYKLSSDLFGNTRDTRLMHEKAKCVAFNYMQSQKVKFKSVQINLKHVSYSLVNQCLAIPGTRVLCMKKQNVLLLIICNRKK